MVVKDRCAFVEPSRMGRVTKTESVAVKVMAEFMTESAEKRAERGDLLADRCPGPDADDGGVDRVVSEQFACPAALTDSQRARSKGTHLRSSNPVKIGRGR
jgi:hypothetical protein